MVKRRLALSLGLCLFGAMPAIVAAQEKPLKIGVLTDISGPFSTIVGENSVEAARMAAEDAGGTVAGRAVVHFKYHIFVVKVEESCRCHSR